MNKYQLLSFWVGVFLSASAIASDTEQSLSDSFDLIDNTESTINSSTTCQGTFDAISAAVSLQPGQAAQVVSRLSVKRDCNCSDGGLWVQRQLQQRILPEARNTMISAEPAYSCAQVAVYAGVAGLPGNQAFSSAGSKAEKRQISEQMSRQVHDILNDTMALQSSNGWECGGVDIIIAAAMQGIDDAELQTDVYATLANLFAADVENAGDTTERAVLACSHVALAYTSHYPVNTLVLHRLSVKRTVEMVDLASPN